MNNLKIYSLKMAKFFFIFSSNLFLLYINNKMDQIKNIYPNSKILLSKINKTIRMYWIKIWLIKYKSLVNKIIGHLLVIKVK